MHERSLAGALLKQVEEQVRALSGCRVEAVSVSIGEFAGVEPLLLASAVEELAQEGFAAGAIFTFAETPLVAECLQCQNEFRVQRFHFHCPACGGGRTRVIRGDAVIIESITLCDEVPANH